MDEKNNLSKTMNIAVVTDNNYTFPLCVMLTSLFENNKKYKIRIYVLYFDLNKHNKNYIQNLINQYKQKVVFCKIDVHNIKNYFKDFGHVSKTTYLKFYIPKVATGIRRILYIDSDIIICGSLNNIWNTNLKGKIVGAVTDYSDARINALGYKQKDGYFNAGLLLIDVNKWNKAKISNQLIDYIVENQDKLVFWDQDAFNAILHNRWLHMPVIYNFQTLMYLNKNKFIGCKSPIVIHYTTDAKPWNFRCNHPLKNQFWKYLKMSRWKDYKMTDITIKNTVYHYMPIRMDLKLSAFIRKLNKKN